MSAALTVAELDARLASEPLRTTSRRGPGGELSLVIGTSTEGQPLVLSSGYFGVEPALERVSALVSTRGVRSVRRVEGVSDAVSAYVDGDLAALDSVEVLQAGGAFMQDAWIALRTVSAGTTTSYTGLAALAGRPSAVRAAGSACAKNLVAPFVPCHRILRTDGSLGGYYYGLPVKAALLAHEGVVNQLTF